MDLMLRGLCPLNVEPPAVLRGRGALFTSLTRLEYGRAVAQVASNLGPLSDSGLFCIPTLVDLTVVGFAFTVDGRDGRTWATDVARASLPRLAVFRLRWLGVETARMPSPQVRYACVYQQHIERFRLTQCLGCGEVGGCVRGREVEE
jgi:hypothetical protein